MIARFDVPATTTIGIPFNSYGSDGHSITITGLAITDIHIYKDRSTTQRASTNGFAVTTDFDGVTGLHLLTIDLNDNTTAGFYAVGSEYMVVVGGTGSPGITVDGQAVSFVAAYFRITPQEGVTGTPKVDVSSWNGAAVATPAVSGTPKVDISHISGDSGAADTAESFFDGTGYAGTNNVIPTVGVVSGAVGSVTGNVGGNVTGSVGSVVGAVGSVSGAVASVTGNVGGNVTGSVGSVATGGITAASVAPDAIGASELAADAVAEIVAAVFARAFSSAYGSLTFDEIVKGVAVACLGKVSGAATTTVTFRNLADNANVIVATVDADGNRSSVTFTP